MSDISVPISEGQSASVVPTDQFRSGSDALGAPMYVLALPEIRNAEVLTTEQVIATVDGPVTGRPGERDIVVYKSKQDRYPITSRIFYGGYEVIGQVANRLVGRRLIQVRVAWPVTADNAEFDYRTGKGFVSVQRGGWLYQSDDDDFGMISRKAQRNAYVMVGSRKSLQKPEQQFWVRRFEYLAFVLTFLPPLLTAIALLSGWAASETHIKWLPGVLTALETGLLFAGAGAYVWARAGRWELKAALNSGRSAALQFQAAAELLGEHKSVDFPQMPLWRAAQGQASGSRISADEKTLRMLRDRVNDMIATIERKINRSRQIESLGTWGAAFAMAAVIGGNLWLIFGERLLPLELITLWLPSLIGAFHALGYRKRVQDQVPLLNEFERQLQFVHFELLGLAKAEAVEQAQGSDELEAVLRLLCNVIGRYCQAELRLALAQHPNLPA